MCVCSLPADVSATLERYLRLVDVALPGRIEGLYLAGSVALGDYRTGQSDVDFVAVTATALTPPEFHRLEEVHATMRRHHGPHLDGIYVTWDDLAHYPANTNAVPFVLEGTLRRGGGREANPSIWLTLRNHPCAIRGPREPELWHDPATIRRWNVENLQSYWRGLADQVENPVSTLDAGAMDRVTVWCVPGVTRLHYTITQMDVVSKTGACDYALVRFLARWHTVIGEARALRTGGAVPRRHPEARRRDVRDFMRFVIDDATAHPSPLR